MNAQSRSKPPDQENPPWVGALRVRGIDWDLRRAKGIMASGAWKGRMNRPDTWPHRPALCRSSRKSLPTESRPHTASSACSGKQNSSLTKFLSCQGSSGRVEMWRGCCRLGISVAAPFVWRCLSGQALAPFPHPAHRTGQADFPQPALGQDVTLTPTAGHT